MEEKHGGEDSPGQLVGQRFVVQESLGEGAVWAAWLGRDLQSGQVVTIKIMVDEAASEAEATPRFLKQAEDAFKLDHPHIVRTLATGTEGGRHYLVCEHVDGCDIRAWFGEGTHSFAELRDKLKSICEALHYAHANGVFHRSLRPECIFVDHQGHVRVTDFGFARRLEGAMRRTSSVTAGSTVTYITPEQARGQRGDARSDLYTLGIVLYEICTGRAPFTDPDPMRVVYRHMHERPVPPRQVDPHIPHWLNHVIMKLMEKDPPRRYQTARDLSQELSKLERLGEGQFIELEASDPARARRMGGDAPLVGRESVEKTLQQMLVRAVQGKGRVALLCGEAGSGKTRAVSELFLRAGLEGALALRGTATCRIRPLLGPFLQILHDFGRRDEGAPAEILGDTAGILECFLEGRLDEVLSHDAAAGLARFHAASLEFVRRLAEQTPLLLAFEDLHNADQPTLELVRLLASHAGSMRLMVVGTWRPEEVPEGSAAEAVLAEIEAWAVARRIALPGLRTEATRTMLLHLAGAQDTSQELAEAVHRATRGLPLAIEEMAGQLLRDKTLHVVEGRLECPDLEQVRSIRGLDTLVVTKVASLPQKASMMLTLAACIGPSFDFDILLKVSGKPQEEVTSVVQWAQHNGWVEPEWHPGRERLRFVHEPYQEALYGSIEPRSRTRLHLLIGMALEEAYALRLRDVIEALAFHYGEAGQQDKSVAYALQAADRQRSLLALDDARRWYARALELLQGADDPEGRRIYCLKSLARIAREQGREDGARLYAEEGLRLAVERKDAVEEKEMRAFL